MTTDPSRTCMDVQSTYDFARIDAMSVNRDSCSQLVMQRMVEAQKACAPSTGSFFTFSTHTGSYIDPPSYQQFCLEKYNMALNIAGLPVVTPIGSNSGSSNSGSSNSGSSNSGSSNSGSSNSSDSGSSKTTILIGAGVGVVVLIALIACACWFMRRPSKKNPHVEVPPAAPYQQFNQQQNGGVYYSDPQPHQPPQPSYQPQHIDDSPIILPGHERLQPQFQQPGGSLYSSQQSFDDLSSRQAADMYAPIELPSTPPVVSAYPSASEEKRSHRLNHDGTQASVFDVYGNTPTAAAAASSRSEPSIQLYDEHSVSIHHSNDSASYAPVQVPVPRVHSANTGSAYAPVTGGDTIELTSVGYDEKRREAESQAANNLLSVGASVAPPPAYNEFWAENEPKR
ncbi:hypothetical protein BDR26DRAFT_860420 [Obelidium mucronatum]|nr:hypothetical protein BDR26DRAFT_860420 [Obelidium mucronatum]